MVAQPILQYNNCNIWVHTEVHHYLVWAWSDLEGVLARMRTSLNNAIYTSLGLVAFSLSYHLLQPSLVENLAPTS